MATHKKTTKIILKPQKLGVKTTRIGVKNTKNEVQFLIKN